MQTEDTIVKADRIVSERRSRGPEGIPILNGVSLALAPGDRVRLGGPSGAGKSTLLQALARMLPLSEGTLSLLGRPSADWPAPIWRCRVAFVLQKHSILNGTVRDNLLLPWTLKIRNATLRGKNAPPPTQGEKSCFRAPRPDDDTLRRELDALGLKEIPVDVDASRLSVGQSARLSLARTLLTAPACLLLDEPLAALDTDSAERVLARLDTYATADGAILMVSHDTAASGKGLNGATRALRLEKGALTEEAP